MNWFEPLPECCPPSEAATSSGVPFYRILKSNSVSEEDFLSHRALYKNRVFRVSECQARSISIFPDIQECSNVMKMPTFKNKETYVGEIVIEEQDGLIVNTPSNVSTKHYSWWRSEIFDIAKVKVIPNE